MIGLESLSVLWLLSPLLWTGAVFWAYRLGGVRGLAWAAGVFLLFAVGVPALPRLTDLDPVREALTTRPPQATEAALPGLTTILIAMVLHASALAGLCACGVMHGLRRVREAWRFILASGAAYAGLFLGLPFAYYVVSVLSGLSEVMVAGGEIPIGYP